jgi:phosphatidylserine decarboxylase
VHEIETEHGRRRISIFLSVADVHVNRAPYAGKVTEVTYKPGRFVPAYRAEASRENESNRVTISSPDGTIEVKQIAGVLARRIVCRAQSGDVLEKGQRYGLIRFGSRTDLFLPADCDVVAQIGDKVRGAETILAYLKVRRDE